ncbi:uncharacterized protein LOC117780728 [Drosophila innubila]|uniref:uncharacterized protein LOC117780728 n=1 Tax=Drosophila innubila TaxID=198719 RepID=UPI00148C2C56|nr:uncharacterized protein LOC117780728 [Drosophila innubila]
MYQLLTYLSCCLLLVAGITVIPESVEEAMTESSFEFPEDFTLHELGEPTSEEDHVMTAHKINWMPIAQGVDPVNMREARDLEHVMQPLEVISETVPTDSIPAKQISVVQTKVKEDLTVEQVENVEVEEVEEQEEDHVPREGSACPSNAERGLTRLIINARPLLPVERLRNILAHAKEDAEVRDLLKLLRSDEFKERVSRLRGTKEKGVLRDYVCQGLKLNHAYFMDYVEMFLNIQTTEMSSSPVPNRRKGVRGLLQDLRDALPRAQLRDLYRRQLAVDKELNTAVRRIRSSEFRRLLSNVRALPEYRAVRSDLEKAGVPLQQILNLVSNALGWGTIDMGSETIIAGV